MNLPIPQKAILKPITNTSGSGIMALWLFDGTVYGYAWPTGRLDRLFLGPKMFSVIVNSTLRVQATDLLINKDEFEDYIFETNKFTVSFAEVDIPEECIVYVMSDDPGLGNPNGEVEFNLTQVNSDEIGEFQKLIPVHRVFFTADHDHMLVTNEEELALILSGKHGKVQYEGVEFYAISAGRE